MIVSFAFIITNENYNAEIASYSENATFTVMLLAYLIFGRI